MGRVWYVSMRKNVHKLYFIWDFDKEEKWLNDMAAKGKNLVSVGFGKFVFEEGTPGEYQYHMEWMEHMPNHPKSIEYREFLEETGFEEVATFKKWLFIRKNTSQMAFDLFSDIDSRMAHLRRILIFMPFLIGVLMLGIMTEYGLWTMEKELLPFTISCISILLFLLVFLLHGLYRSTKAYTKLKKERQIRE